MDQRQLAELSLVSLPTIQRMEASEGNVRGTVDTLTKVVEALDRVGIELIGENSQSRGIGRGVRFKQPKAATSAPPARRTGDGRSRPHRRTDPFPPNDNERS